MGGGGGGGLGLGGGGGGGAGQVGGGGEGVRTAADPWRVRCPAPGRLLRPQLAARGWPAPAPRHTRGGLEGKGSVGRLRPGGWSVTSFLTQCRLCAAVCTVEWQLLFVVGSQLPCSGAYTCITQWDVTCRSLQQPWRCMAAGV
jgi:hypothetical protein